MYYGYININSKFYLFKYRIVIIIILVIETVYPDMSYFTVVLWLGHEKGLSRFFKLRNKIEIFLIEKNRPLLLLTDYK